MAFWAYILICADGKFCTGHTDDLECRFGEHQTGGFCDFTSRRLPVELAWSEAFGSRIEALEAERIVGGWSRAKKQALIAGNWSKVSHFAKPPRERSSASPDVPPPSAAHAAFATPFPFVSGEVEKQAPSAVPGFSTLLETNGPRNPGTEAER